MDIQENVSTPEQAPRRSVNLSEVRQQIVAAVSAGEISKEDVSMFTQLLNQQVEASGALSPVATRAGQLAERAFMTDHQGVVITKGDESRNPIGSIEHRSASGGGRVSD